MTRSYKTILAVLLFAIQPVYSVAQLMTPPAVRDFYKGMEQLTQCNNSAQSSELEMKMIKCFFGHENSGMNLPNDFKDIDIDAGSVSHTFSTLTSNNYVGKLGNYIAKEKVLTPTVQISSYTQTTGKVPSIGVTSHGSMQMSSENAYYRTIVKKRFSYRKASGEIAHKEFVDTVYTHTTINKISAIRNNSYFGGKNDENDKELLKLKAAQAYESNNFISAYKIFERIISLDRDEGEALYRLALMTYYGKGCKADRRKGKRLMREASYKYGVFSEKARNVWRNWKIPNNL